MSIKFLAFAGAVLTASVAEANAIPEVQTFLKQEITKQVAAQAPTGPLDSPDAYASYGDWEFALFRLQVRADFGFDVSFGRITVFPVVEFFWER